MKLYISGGISGYADGNKPAFKQAELALSDAGYSVVNPAEHEVEGWTWAQYLKYDLPLMLQCEGVAVLNGWFHSKGANLEVYVARQLGMQVKTPEQWIAWDWRQAA